MSFWRKLLRRDGNMRPYGLHSDRLVLCGGGVDGEIDYLTRLRCPSGAPLRYRRTGSLQRTGIDDLSGEHVRLAVSRSIRRHLGSDPDPLQIPLDCYVIACECGRHREKLFVDMYFRGPEMAIGKPGWTLQPGTAPGDIPEPGADCPYCGKELRTAAARQCRFCKMDWHDPENAFRRGSGPSSTAS